MKSEVENLLLSTARLDPSITSDRLMRAMAILRGEDAPQALPIIDGRSRLYLRSELAHYFRQTKQTISNWARTGRLHAVKDARGQTIGYTPESVGALPRGER